MIPTKQFLKNNSLEILKKIEHMESPTEKYQPLIRGNTKLAKGIFNFSVLPVVTCGMQCKGCYAVKSLRYQNVRDIRLYNTWLAVHKLDYLYNAIIGQVKRARSIKYIRIHVAGDFFSEEYLNMWLKVAHWVAANKPHVKLYTYTKTSYGNTLNANGINCVESILPNGETNFDTLETLQELRKKYEGYTICPATLKNGIRCGIDCTKCMHSKKVLFVRH
jgi:hypothetical protein